MRKFIAATLAAAALLGFFAAPARAQEMRGPTTTDAAAAQYLGRLGLSGLNLPTQEGMLSMVCGDAVFPPGNIYNPPPAFKAHCLDGLHGYGRNTELAEQTNEVRSPVFHLKSGAPAPMAAAYSAAVMMDWYGRWAASNGAGIEFLDDCPAIPLPIGSAGSAYVCHLSAGGPFGKYNHFIAVRVLPIPGSPVSLLVIYSTAGTQGSQLITREDFLGEFLRLAGGASVKKAPQ
jgi:hypothetical protein